MAKTPPAPVANAVEPSALDLVLTFFETVFTGTANEPAPHKAAIGALISQAFGEGYTFNGGKMAPKDLVAWRDSLLAKLNSMTFLMNNALSCLVDVAPAKPTTAVSISWTVYAIEPDGNRLR